MITPKQKLLLNKIQNQHPYLKSLDLIPIPSPEFKKSKAIQARVETIFKTLEKASNSPVDKRSVLKTDSNWSDGEFVPPGPPIEPEERNKWISDYLTSLYGPKPWKFPLPFAPF